MRYERFELFAIGISGLIVLAVTITAARVSSNPLLELVAGLLLLIVLAAAVHFGRRGGLIAAIAASAIYVMLSVPVSASAGGLTSDEFLLLVIRIATFGLIGIVGGEACGRLRHVLMRFAHAETFDEWNHVFNQRYAFASLDRALGLFERYSEPFTAIVLTLSPSLTAGMSAARVRALVRGVGVHLRSDLRMIDEVARLDDGRFFVMLPHTPAEGGRVVAQRMARGVRRLLGASDEAVTVRALSATDDMPALVALVNEIRVPDEGHNKAYSSGVYSSAGASDRNPALASDASAPGASTLNTSTAAAPEGSTKQ